MRNRNLDNKRCDSKEACIEYKYENKEKHWFLEGDNLKAFGLLPSKKFTALTGKGELTKKTTQILGDFNVFSLSLSIIPRSDFDRIIKKTAKNLGFTENEYVVLILKKPKKFSYNSFKPKIC